MFAWLCISHVDGMGGEGCLAWSAPAEASTGIKWKTGVPGGRITPRMLTSREIDQTVR